MTLIILVAVHITMTATIFGTFLFILITFLTIVALSSKILLFNFDIL